MAQNCRLPPVQHQSPNDSTGNAAFKRRVYGDGGEVVSRLTTLHLVSRTLHKFLAPVEILEESL